MGEVLRFFSGTDREPPIGFEKRPTIRFLTAKLPTSNTCDVVLRLPVIHKTYNDFKDAMILALKGHDGFGGV